MRCRCLYLLLVLSCIVFGAGNDIKIWDFSKGMQGWKPGDWESYEITPEGFKGVTKYDCKLMSPDLGFDASAYDTLVVAMKSNKNGHGEVFVGSNGRPLSDDRMIQHFVTASDELRLSFIPLAGGRGWEGKIDGIRFDALNPAGVEVTIAFLALVKGNSGLIADGDFEYFLDGKSLEWKLEGGSEIIAGRALKGLRSLRLNKAESMATCRLSDVSFLGMFRVRGSSRGGSLFVGIDFAGIDGNVLKSSRSLVRGRGDWGEFDFTFEAPERAFTGVLCVEPAGDWESAIDVDCLVVENTEHGMISESLPARPRWKASWIWEPSTITADNCVAWFRKTITVPEKPWDVAMMQVTCDDSFALHVNGRQVASTHGIPDAWRTPLLLDLSKELRVGDNELLIECQDKTAAQGLLAEIVLEHDGKRYEWLTGSDWEASTGREGPWVASHVLGRVPCSPWLDVPYAVMGTRPGLSVEFAEAGLPKRVVAGRRLLVPLRFKGTIPDVPIGVKASLVRDGKVLSESWARNGVEVVDGVGVVNGLNLPVPSSLASGEATVEVECIGVNQRGGTLRGKVEVEARDRLQGSEFAKTKLERVNGITRLRVDGKLLEPTQLLLNRPDERQQGNAKEAGAHLLGIGLSQFGFYEDGFDYTKVDEKLESFLAIDPDAYLILNFTLDTSHHKWWIAAHPEARCRHENGNDDVGAYSGNHGWLPSYGSDVWRDTFTDALRRLIRHLKTTPYAKRIVGFHPCMGISWEWFHWGSQSNECVDYSECGQADFRRWLRDKYKTDAALRVAWGREDVDLASAKVPSEARRRKSEAGMFYDVKTQRDVLDYHDYQHDVVADTIIHLGKVVKEETGGRSLCGTYYGYTMHLPESVFFCQGSGHFRLVKLLESPYIDYCVSPVSYGHRQVGGTAGTMMAPWTYNLNGKLMWNQADLRTHWYAPEGFGRPRTVQGSIACMRRELARNLAEGNAIQWYDFSIGWTMGDKRLMDEVARQKAILSTERYKVKDWPEKDYLLVVVDELAMGCWDVSNPPYELQLIYEQRKYLAESGVPWRAVLMSDLLKHKELLKHKAILFLNPFKLTPEQVDFLKKNVLCKGRMVGFMGPVGIFQETGLSTSVAEDLLGCGIEFHRDPINLRGASFPPWSGSKELWWGTTAKKTFTEIFLPKSLADAEVVCHLIDDPEDTSKGRVAAFVKDRGDWTLFWSAVPGLRAPLLRELARRSGVPVVSSSDDPLFAGRGFVGIHAASNGEKRIVMPRAGKVRELISGKRWKGKTKEITVPMKVGETLIFVAE